MTRQRLTAALSGSLLVVIAMRAPALADGAPGSRDDQTAPERQPGYFQLGAAYSPDEGPIFGAAVVQPDLFGTGQALSLAAELSGLRESFDLRYHAPTPLGVPFDVTAELFDHRRRYPRVDRHGTGGQLTLSREVAPNTTAYVGYRVEHVDVTPIDGASRPWFAGGDSALDPWRGGLTASVRAGLIYDTVEDAPYPRRGTRAELFGEVADARTGSEIELRRVGAGLDHRTPVGPFTLHVRGAIEAIDSPGGVPMAQRLYLDGHADVRGFGLDAVAPYGGTAIATGRAELEIPLIPSWGLYGAVFYDAGVIADRDGLTGPDHAVVHSAGASLIWRSPIGAIRLDVALPLSGSDDMIPLISIGL